MNYLSEILTEMKTMLSLRQSILNKAILALLGRTKRAVIIAVMGMCLPALGQVVRPPEPNYPPGYDPNVSSFQLIDVMTAVLGQQAHYDWRIWVPEDTVAQVTVRELTGQGLVNQPARGSVVPYASDPNYPNAMLLSWSVLFTPSQEGPLILEIENLIPGEDFDTRTVYVDVTRPKLKPIMLRATGPITYAPWFWKVNEVARHPDKYAPTATKKQLAKSWQELKKIISGAVGDGRQHSAETLLIKSGVKVPKYVDSIP